MEFFDMTSAGNMLPLSRKPTSADICLFAITLIFVLGVASVAFIYGTGGPVHAHVKALNTTQTHPNITGHEVPADVNAVTLSNNPETSTQVHLTPAPKTNEVEMSGYQETIAMDEVTPANVPEALSEVNPIPTKKYDKGTDPYDIFNILGGTPTEHL